MNRCFLTTLSLVSLVSACVPPKPNETIASLRKPTATAARATHVTQSAPTATHAHIDDSTARSLERSAGAKFTAWLPPRDVIGLDVEARSADGRIAARAQGMVISVVDTKALTRRFLLGATGVIDAIALTHDGALLAAHETREKEAVGSVHIYRTESGELVSEVDDSGGASLSQPILAFAPDGATLLSSDKNALRVREVPSGRARATIDLKEQASWNEREVQFIGALAVIELKEQYGTRFAVLLVDTARGMILARPLVEDAFYHRPGPSFVVAPNGRIVAIRASEPARVELWDLVRGVRLGALTSPRCAASRFHLAMAFDERSERFAEGHMADELCIWNVGTRALVRRIVVPALATRKPVRDPEQWQAMVTSVAFMPSGRELLVGEAWESISSFNLQSGTNTSLRAGDVREVRARGAELQVLETGPGGITLTHIAPDLTQRFAALGVDDNRPRFEGDAHVRAGGFLFDITGKKLGSERCEEGGLAGPCVYDAGGQLRSRFPEPETKELARCALAGKLYPRAVCVPVLGETAWDPKPKK